MRNEKLKITIIQSDLHWQNKVKNLKMFEKKIKSISGKTDLIILPEMFTSGFSMEVEKLSENWDDSFTLQWLQEQSELYNTAICGSFIVRENEVYYNRLAFVKPNKSVQKYDKKHLFRMAKEDLYFSEGQEKIIIELDGWKICPLICYDLRFPIWSRNKNLEYDILIYVANWPEKRRQAWQTLLKARAIENLSYSIGVNRVGTDSNGIYYSGDSVVNDFLGNELYSKKDAEDVITLAFSKKALVNYRNKFPTHLDADN